MTATESKRHACLEPGLSPEQLQPGTRIRKSKAGRWRALVLLAVNLAIVGHFAHWWTSGETLSPLEPSESMAFSKEGIVNAGLIFFALTIVGTLIFGRWFCGWACHIVALQDASYWLLKKLRLRPRHVDLGVLGWVPWLAFIYMFLMPIAYRLVIGLGLAKSELALTTTDFWATFPDWLTAVLTCLVVGFAMVWFLGSKGFCSYGCPYGGIFGLADQLAPLRIRVTDACSGCGHCTAVCTSNVQVHQEVRDWKTVVDSACMKCMDCVSVCPKDALYVGWGAPAVLTKSRATSAPAPKSSKRAAWVELALLAGFFAATMFVFLVSNPRQFDLLGPMVLVLTAFSVLVALPFRGKSRRRGEYTVAEEIVLALAFLFAMQGIHGQHITVHLPGSEAIVFPFLFALGLSATLAYLLVQAWRVLRRSNLSLQRIALRTNGRVQPAGVVLNGLAIGLVGLLGWSGWSRAGDVRAEYRELVAQREEAQSHERNARVAQEHFNRGLAAADKERLEEALGEFRAAVEAAPAFIQARENMAGMLCALGRFREGIEQYQIALKQNPGDADTHAYVARAYLAMNDLKSARVELEKAVELAPERAELHAALGEVCGALGDRECAEREEKRVRELLEAAQNGNANGK